MRSLDPVQRVPKTLRPLISRDSVCLQAADSVLLSRHRLSSFRRRRIRLILARRFVLRYRPSFLRGSETENLPLSSIRHVRGTIKLVIVVGIAVLASSSSLLPLRQLFKGRLEIRELSGLIYLMLHRVRLDVSRMPQICQAGTTPRRRRCTGVSRSVKRTR